jgi:hypothetical protein
MIDRETARVIRTGDPLADWVRAAVGQSVQIRVPLRDQIDLRRSAEILRTFANELEKASHVKDGSDRAVMLAWAAARMTQARLKSRPTSDRKNGAASVG